MGPLSYMRSIVDRNVVMRRIPVIRAPVQVRTVFQKNTSPCIRPMMNRMGSSAL